MLSYIHIQMQFWQLSKMADLGEKTNHFNVLVIQVSLYGVNYWDGATLNEWYRRCFYYSIFIATHIKLESLRIIHKYVAKVQKGDALPINPALRSTTKTQIKAKFSFPVGQRTIQMVWEREYVNSTQATHQMICSWQTIKSCLTDANTDKLDQDAKGTK